MVSTRPPVIAIVFCANAGKAAVMLRATKALTAEQRMLRIIDLLQEQLPVIAEIRLWKLETLKLLKLVKP
jgi:hypothetical protein